MTEKYEAQFERMAGYNLNLRNEIQDVRKNMDDMSKRHAEELDVLKQKYESEMAEIRASLERTERRAQLVEDWAGRLCSQVESLGEKPVPFEVKPRNPTQPRKDK